MPLSLLLVNIALFTFVIAGSVAILLADSPYDEEKASKRDGEKWDGTIKCLVEVHIIKDDISAEKDSGD